MNVSGLTLIKAFCHAKSRDSRNCSTSWARSRSIETKRSRECAVLMELGACHECASGSNLVFRVDFCSQIHRVRIFCGGQEGAFVIDSIETIGFPECPIPRCPRFTSRDSASDELRAGQ